MQDIGAGLWHTVCTSVDGDVYSFGGNQFGQLGTGSDQAEVQILLSKVHWWSLNL
jgi:alpha-tubulin suppressor-like RCC1 family protein